MGRGQLADALLAQVGEFVRVNVLIGASDDWCRWMVVRFSRVPLNFGGGPHDRQAAITLSWPTSGAREDDESLGRSGQRDIALDCSFDARTERPWVDEDNQVKLEPLRQLRGQRLDAGRRPGRGIADDTGDSVGMRVEPAVEDRVQIRDRTMDDGDVVAADRGRHVGVREHGPDDRLGFRHDLFRRPVVDAQRGEVDPVKPEPLEPLLPRLGEPLPGLGAVPDDLLGVGPLAPENTGEPKRVSGELRRFFGPENSA